MNIELQAETAPGHRRCSGCTLCCKLLPVKDIDKKAGVRCQHQRIGKGCAVYKDLMRISPSCALWNCRWLVNDDTADLRRPDRSHYVIDIMPDFITITEPDKESINVEVVQVWVDPAYPDAYKDPALLAYLERRGEDGIAAIIRYSSDDGFVMLPPAMMDSGNFYEHRHDTARRERTTEERLAGLATVRKVKLETRNE